MSDEIVSATGERAAIGGYLPQFDEFAWFVYLNLINNKLEWIRVADPKAEKLDDIQFSTYSELHAYQVKWTIADAKISFSNFTELIPLITTSWKNLIESNSSKKVIPHLITNKPVSSHDSLKDGDIKIGSFEDFISEVWIKLKSSQPVDQKWDSIVSDFQKETNLDDAQFKEFIRVFDFQPDYKPKHFSVGNTRYSKEDDDLQQISRFIIEKVASVDRSIQFSRQDIINGLSWTDRFKTVFNHELIVDRQRYQPIQTTIDQLNAKLLQYNNGYLFLQGGPGSGKSTLLNQWSKGLKARIVRYYAFDFVNPSSHLNFYERGNATHLFFDLVFQLKEAGIYKRNILPYKDLIFLKDVFNEQLKAIGQDFLANGQPTVIIIDGLDHVPREYKSAVNSFLRELPFPSSLPNGVFIILGSQSYDLEDIRQEIKYEFRKGDRTIQIDSLKKEEVYKYLNNISSTIKLSDVQKLQIFEKSQGHPLYLSYLIEKIIGSNSIDDVINSFEAIDGSIENYYAKIWSPLQQEEDLIQFLGLIARINGAINLRFVEEWGTSRNVLKSFREKAKVLFNDVENSLTFFHNSFRQFLLYHTSKKYLTDEFDQSENRRYHSQLADYYLKSSVEKSWKKNHHIFQARQYERFVSEVTPDSLTAQLLEFRPVEEIKQDAKLGVELARQNRDINVLIGYLFSLAEVERRQYSVDPAAFTEEFLILGKLQIAINYLRTGNVLHVKKSYAINASRLFMQFGHKAEGTYLFNLAYPEVIANSGISIGDSHRYDDIRADLEEWVYAAPYFETTEEIIAKIENIQVSKIARSDGFDERDLNLRLITNLGYSLIEQNKWDDLDAVIRKVVVAKLDERSILFSLLQESIEHCLRLKDNIRANEYLLLLTTNFTKDKTKSIGRVYIADLVFRVTGNVSEVLNWIIDVEQPSCVGKDSLGYDGSLDGFIPLIKLNKLLNICGEGVEITSAIPSVEKGSDEQVLVEFERMLCLITKILSDGLLSKQPFEDITKRALPIVRFYYRDVSHRNSYWYKITKTKGEYFNFLIAAVSEFGIEKLETLGDSLFTEFDDNPKYWNTTDRRKIVKSLVLRGFNSEKAKAQLVTIEPSMLGNRDIDGRVAECIAHADVWFALEELGIGEKWLKQAIQESIGVGYSKDYQFSTWIEWLRIINLKDPLSATERIKWFLSHLNHIKRTTEGRAYWSASDKLLATIYEFNLNDGLEQSIWQLDRGLVDFRESLALFIEHFVNRVKNEEELKYIIQLYNGLYFLVAESVNTSLVRSICEKGYDVLQDVFLEKYLPLVIHAINIRSYEGNRYDLLAEIEKFGTSKGLKISDYDSAFIVPVESNPNNSSSSSNELKLKDNHGRIDESAVLNRVQNVDDLKSLIRTEDRANSFFNWEGVVDKIAPLLTSTDVKEVANAALGSRKELDVFVKLSEVALKLGEHELAESLANKSLELSSEAGWIRFYDGGTRINAINALRKVNPTEATNKAFEVFARDIIGSSYPSSYVEHLDEIVPLLTENYSEEEIWPEVFSYLQRLMSNSKPDADLPSFKSIEKPIIETFIDYILYLLSSPVSLVREEAIVLFASCISQNDERALNFLIKGRLDDYSAIDIIMTLRELNFQKLSEVKPLIRSLSLSKDYSIRENARQILTELNEDIPFPDSVDWPTVYSLHLPEIKELTIRIDDDPYFPNVDINNPSDLIRPFDYLITGLSKVSSIDESNLTYRTYSIMKEIGRKEEWTVEYEKKLSDHLGEIYLKYPYKRPRVLVAWRAIMHVACELVNSGTIKDDHFRGLFTSDDYAVPHFDEIAKPEFIQSLKEFDSGGVGNDWVMRIGESKRLSELLLTYQENFRIIGEYYKVKNLDWGTPTEECMYQVSVNDKISCDDNDFFGSVFQQLTGNYYGISGGGRSVIVVRDHRFGRFDLKSNWIAVNPTLARYLKWTPDPGKLFGWKNSKGETMAESVYWVNGNMQMPARQDGEVGEGWFVIVSNEGLHQINSIEPNLFLQRKVIRTKYEDSHLTSNQIYNVIKIKPLAHKKQSV